MWGPFHNKSGAIVNWENVWRNNFVKFTNPVHPGRKLNVHKTFRRRPGRLLNVLCTFNLRPVSTGKSFNKTTYFCL